MVDLYRAEGQPLGGYVTFRNGVTFHSITVGQDEDGEYEIRLEHAEYRGYTREGMRCQIGIVDGKKHWVRLQSAADSPWDVVAFERADFDKSRGITSDFSAACRGIDR